MTIEDSNLRENVVSALNEFYESYLIETVDGSFQIFQSMSYGEMLISFLLLIAICLYVFKWLWEVLR